MGSREVYAGLPLDQRLKRLARTPDDWAAPMPVHDDNHFDQLTRAISGRA